LDSITELFDWGLLHDKTLVVVTFDCICGVFLDQGWTMCDLDSYYKANNRYSGATKKKKRKASYQITSHRDPSTRNSLNEKIL
jgi:hypothetical protein